MRTARPFARRAAILLAVALAPAGAACTQTVRGGGPQAQAQASVIFEHIQAERAAGKLDEAALDARHLLNQYPDFARIDEATYLAGEIATEQKRYADAARHYQALVDDYPQSPFHNQALLGAARAYEQLDMSRDAAAALVQLLQSPAEPSVRSQTENELEGLVRTKLGAADLQELVKKYPNSPLSREIAIRLARQAYARGDYDESYKLLTEYLYNFPEESETSEARRLLGLASERRQNPEAGTATMIHPNTIGVVLPVTGAGSLFGRYFQQGIDVAVDEHNAEGGGRKITVVQADSKGNAVGAVKAVRRLVLEKGAIGIMGAVFTVPTITAAIEANAWGVPLLSPLVSTDELLEVGPWIFQTRVPAEVEATAVAELAVERMHIERFAVVAPANGQRRTVGDLFADEVERLGGKVVSQQYYAEGATDYREPLEAVKESAPDAIFAPGSVEELLLLIPQIKFYDLQVQLFGLSDWNSDKLLRLSRDELEGAVYPVAGYRGKDRAAAVGFEEKMRKKGMTDISPVTAAGYFGMHLLIQALDSGASSRADVRAYLEHELRGGADTRMAEAKAVNFVIVRDGKPVPFNPAGK